MASGTRQRVVASGEPGAHAGRRGRRARRLGELAGLEGLRDKFRAPLRFPLDCAHRNVDMAQENVTYAGLFAQRSSRAGAAGP